MPVYQRRLDKMGIRWWEVKDYLDFIEFIDFQELRDYY